MIDVYLSGVFLGFWGGAAVPAWKMSKEDKSIHERELINMAQLTIKEYGQAIHLHERSIPIDPVNPLERVRVTQSLIEGLLGEPEMPESAEIPKSYEEKRKLLRGLLNIRPPYPMEPDFLNNLDGLLQLELKERGVAEASSLPMTSDEFPGTSVKHADKMSLWRGDITLIDTDAIVNAANEQLLGCWQPLHECIDNAIHSAAGPELREDCNTIMAMQQEPEKTGGAKVTRAYNLPSGFVMHTVGPIIEGGRTPTEEEEKQLASCYISCLEAAAEVEEIKTITFCAISTGAFGYPKEEAASVAVETVSGWLASHPDRFSQIVFNVFGKEDEMAYKNVFEKN